MYNLSLTTVLIVIYILFTYWV